MDNLVEELNQELKEENLRNLFIKYFPYLLTFIALIMAGISLILWYKSVNEMRNEQATNHYLEYFMAKVPQDFNKIKQEIIETGSNLKEFLTIIDPSYTEVRSKLLKDLEAVNKDTKANKGNIFYLTILEKEIVNYIQNSNFNEAQLLLKEILKVEYIPGSMNNRLEALRVMIEEKK